MMLLRSNYDIYITFAITIDCETLEFTDSLVCVLVFKLDLQMHLL